MKESKAWDGGQQPGKKLGFKLRSAEGAGDTAGRARFEDSASEEGTTGRTRVRTSCPVQELRGVSLESGYSTNLSVPTPECFNDWGGRGYDDSVPGEVTKTTPSGDRTT